MLAPISGKFGLVGAGVEDAVDVHSAGAVANAKGSSQEPMQIVPPASQENHVRRPPSGARVIRKGVRPSVNPVDARNKAVYNAMESLLEHGPYSSAELFKKIMCLSGPEFIQVRAAALLLLRKQHICTGH